LKEISKFLCRASIVYLLLLLAGMATIVNAQGRMTIQATATGTSTQMGKLVNVNISGLRHSATRMQTDREQEEATGRDRDLSKPLEAIELHGFQRLRSAV
jgi:hypothetical protein